MHKVVLLAKREYMASVRTKGFIIGLVLAPIFMGGSLIAFLLLKDRVDTTDKRIGILDWSGAVAESVISSAEYRNTNEIFHEETGRKIKPAYHFELIESDSTDILALRLRISDRVRSGELHAFLEIGEGIVHPADNQDAAYVHYYTENAALDDIRRWIQWPINNQLRRLRLADAGINETDVSDLFHWISVEGLGLVSYDQNTGDIQDGRRASEVEAILIPIVFMMLMFLMVMMSVPGMLQSVMEEKTQRIAEVLLGSIKPFQFMLGKLIGGVGVSLTSSAVYLIGGTIVIKILGYEEYVPFHVIPWFLTFMLFAIIMLGSIASALGATCSEPKDTQSLTIPALLPIMIPMFVYFPVVREPGGSFATIMSLIPPFTPLLMLLRMATPEPVPSWQPLIGLMGVALITVFFVWAGGRLFRVAILMQGTPPKLSNIIQWAFKG